MIPADTHTKRLERRIHNQRVQLAWWTEDAAMKGWRHFRRLHKAVIESYRRTAAKRQAAKDEIERLKDAITDALPGLSAIDDGTWHEYTGDLVLKEDQWNAICTATRELRVALAGGEARSVSAPGDSAYNLPYDVSAPT